MQSRNATLQRRRNRRSRLSEKFRLLRARREETSTAEVGSGRVREGVVGEGGMGEMVVGGEGTGMGEMVVGGEGGMGEGGEEEEGKEEAGMGEEEGGMIEAGEEEEGVIEWEEEGIEESDSSVDTPLGKRKHEADYACFPTPVRRKILAEDPVSTIGFVGNTSHIRSFVNQVNCMSKCNTPGCSGLLKVVQVKAMGLGGAVEVSFQCSGCVARSLTFSTVDETSEQPLLSIALQVAFVCAGCTHAHYTKVLGKALGMCTVDERDFYKTLELMYPHCKAILDCMCEEAKEQLKAMDPNELGSWERAVTCGDAAWLTRGYHSQNCTFHIRDYMNGAVLYYHHLCQRGKDTMVEGDLYQGTSKSAEGYGASIVFEQAKKEGLQIEAHFEDGDSSSPLSLRQYYPKTNLMLCGGHAACSHEKQLKSLQKRKHFSSDEKQKYREKYPYIDSAVCHCTKKHAYKAGCGCFSDGFIKQAKANFTAALFGAKTDADKFARTMKCLGEHHARNEHEWEGGHCEFHPLKHCSCGKCSGDDIKCSGKPYKAKNPLTCPFHRLAYQIECDKRASQSTVLVHPILGRGHTNKVEAAHSVFIKFRAKDQNLQRLHYNVSTNLALMQSNMTWLFKKRGPQYHWLLDLFERMGLPIHAGMAETLKLSNNKRAKTLAYRKTKEAKKKKSQSIAKHKGEEQHQRKAWGKKQKFLHSYGPEPLDDDSLCTPTRARKGRSRKILSETGCKASGAGKRPCRCGSLDHSRTSHRDCPMNKHNVAAVITTADSGDEESGAANELLESECSGDERNSSEEGSGYTSEEGSSDEQCSGNSSDDNSDEQCSGNSSDDNSDEGEWCVCGGERTHSRQCPLNPRNVGKRTGGVSMPVPRANSPSSDSLDSEGEGISKCEPRTDFEITGTPTPSWRDDAIDFLGTLAGVPLVQVLEGIRPMECLEIAPHIRDSIRADGNCMYRAISKQVTGSQENHMALRLAMIKFMLQEEHAIALARISGVNFDGDVLDVCERKRRAVAALQNYVDKQGIRRQSTWGTEKELFVIATMLQLEILVFSGVSRNERGWECIRPIFSKPTCMPRCGFKIFLYHNRSGDHYDCVIPQ